MLLSDVVTIGRFGTDRQDLAAARDRLTDRAELGNHPRWAADEHDLAEVHDAVDGQPSAFCQSSTAVTVAEPKVPSVLPGL